MTTRFIGLTKCKQTDINLSKKYKIVEHSEVGEAAGRAGEGSRAGVPSSMYSYRDIDNGLNNVNVVKRVRFNYEQ